MDNSRDYEASRVLTKEGGAIADVAEAIRLLSEVVTELAYSPSNNLYYSMERRERMERVRELVRRL